MSITGYTADTKLGKLAQDKLLGRAVRAIDVNGDMARRELVGNLDLLFDAGGIKADLHI